LVGPAEAIEDLDEGLTLFLVPVVVGRQLDAFWDSSLPLDPYGLESHCVHMLPHPGLLSEHQGPTGCAYTISLPTHVPGPESLDSKG
jgi:hypothetical protein